MWPARTPPTRVQGGGRRPVLAGGGTPGARASRAGLGGMFRPSAPLVCMLAQRCGKKNWRASPQNDPAGSPGWGRCGVGTCEARGLGGGLRARFLYWDTILCMSTKRPTTKKQRSSPNPSSASNAEVSGEERVERDFFWERARARIFCWESTGGIDTNRSTIKNRVANPNPCALPPPRERSAEEGELDAHRFRVMHGGFCI